MVDPRTRATPGASRQFHFPLKVGSLVDVMPSICGSRSAEHGLLACDGQDLFEEVADVDDAQAAVAEPAHGLQQRLGLAGRQRRRRFVEDDRADVAGEGAEQFDLLLVGHPKLGDAVLGRDVQPDAVAELGVGAAHVRPADHAEPGLLGADRCGTRASSWDITLMPSASASAGEW